MIIDSSGIIESPDLISYLQNRSIDLNIARSFCKEIRYHIDNRKGTYRAIGFQNDAGGWELRNPKFKGSSTPKNITTLKNGSDTVMVFEGFMDFLSYLTLKKNRRRSESKGGLQTLPSDKEEGEANPHPTIDSVVLNSVALLKKAITFLQSHRTIHTFLDNDQAGQLATAELCGYALTARWSISLLSTEITKT